MQANNQFAEILIFCKQYPLFNKCPVQYIFVNRAGHRLCDIQNVVTVVAQRSRQRGIATFVNQKSHSRWPSANTISSWAK